ncbi:MAG: helix-turn-helix transcriptional regulator [Acidimicrobiales bacterium]
MKHDENGIDHLAALASLNEPLRRRIYEHARGQDDGVSRDGVAAALGVARSVAAFHLDKLVVVGLLEVGYRRPPGRSGPGAGRPAKWYRRAVGEIGCSVPERRYGLAAALLARAITRAASGTVGVEEALCDVARQHGQEMGGVLRAASGSSSDRERLVELLAEHGYEPKMSGDRITLANCPFQTLTEEHRDLVCHMNFELLRGMADEAGLPPGAARLDPSPRRCCVTLPA